MKAANKHICENSRDSRRDRRTTHISLHKDRDKLCITFCHAAILLDGGCH